jgi:UDPglucose 6-dehydrogenase
MANTIMELAHYSPNTNCDDVIDALSMASSRLISPAYLRGGMGDGGGCHPRDNIALSWFSKKNNIRFDWFESIMLAREKQCDFLADLIENEYRTTKKTVIILGLSFKPNTSIIVGSTSVLLTNILKERDIPFEIHDPIYSKNVELPTKSGIYFVGCKHSIFNSYSLPKDSILIDPHRSFSHIIPYGKYIPIGKNTN